MLRVREDLGGVQSDDVVRDDVDGLGGGGVVVDPEEGVEPCYFVRDEFARDEALQRRERKRKKRVLARR